MSYSHNINVEFCFNCHNLSRQHPDRARVNSSVGGIRYRGGMTHTGRATRCVSDYILNPSSGCGANTSADCVDIIYITDGHSNGPLRYPQSCNEARCLKNHPIWCGKVNTYAIAIGPHVNRREIQCLTRNDEDSIFNLPSFAELERLINSTYNKLMSDNSYHCVQHTDTDILL